MTVTTYLCYVAGGKCPNTFEEPENGILPKTYQEFWVAETLARMGITAYCPKEMRFMRKGKQRRPEPHIRPYIPNYIFVEIPIQRYFEVMQVKYISPTAYAMRDRDIVSMRKFITCADNEFKLNDRRRQNQEAVCEYTSGQALRCIDEGFGDALIAFVKMVERNHDPHAKVQALVKMMGRDVITEFDPLAVKAI